MAVIELNHPLIQHKLTILRDKKTDTKAFRENLNEIAKLMTYEATKKLALKAVTVKTPLGEAEGFQLRDKAIAIVPIMRAGMGMLDGILSLIPTAKVGHIGVYRDEETLKPVDYYCKLPLDVAERKVLLLDPMLATGRSVVYAIDYLKKNGVRDMVFMGIIAAPEGIAHMQAMHPDVEIYITKIDRGLNEDSFIYPGLGDCGDRIFGTK